jgi:hypothetical protein
MCEISEIGMWNIYPKAKARDDKSQLLLILLATTFLSHPLPLCLNHFHHCHLDQSVSSATRWTPRGTVTPAASTFASATTTRGPVWELC